MFTGLVEDAGSVVSAECRRIRAAGARLRCARRRCVGPERGVRRALRPQRIPHTRLAIGSRVHLEADILAKHVEKLLKP